MKTEDIKNKAIDLRRKGKSYGQIAGFLSVSKSTVSVWFKNVIWSQDVKKQLIKKSNGASRKRLITLNNVRKEKLDKYYQQAEAEAIQEFASLKENKLFITAISLYWGEGDKVFKNGIVRVSNIDEKVLKVFNSFLQKICRINSQKIRADILLYPDLDPKKCLKFWSKEIGVLEDKFFKPTVIQGKHKINRLGNGVCIVSVHEKYLKKKILVWLELFRKEF